MACFESPALSVWPVCCTHPPWALVWLALAGSFLGREKNVCTYTHSFSHGASRGGHREREREREGQRERKSSSKRAAAGLRGAQPCIQSSAAPHLTQLSPALQNLTWPTLVISGGNQESGMAYLGLQQHTKEPYCDPPRRPPSSRFPNLAGQGGAGGGNGKFGRWHSRSTRPNHCSRRPQCPRRLVGRGRRTESDGTVPITYTNISPVLSCAVLSESGCLELLHERGGCGLAGPRHLLRLISGRPHPVLPSRVSIATCKTRGNAYYSITSRPRW